MTKDQIFIAICDKIFPEKAFEYAKRVAEKHEKEICLISLTKNDILNRQAQKFQEKTNIKINTYPNLTGENLDEILEKEEASMLVFEISNQKPFNNISYLLKITRNLRIPYVFVKESFSDIKFEKVLVPISFLVEEKEKGPFASGLGRHMQSEILLMPANDYGSKTKHNVNAIKTLLNKFNIQQTEIKAKKDSYKVEMEAVKRAKKENADLVLITASRDYGLDDIIFGPKELHIIKKTEVPIMVLNPRGDLYVLCG